ncbi:hypothetical protein D3C72_1447550 [compost metagenome]
MAQVVHRFVDLWRPVVPVQRAFTDFDAHAHAVQGDGLLGQRIKACSGDAVELLAAMHLADDQLAFFQEGQGRIDDARAWAVVAAEQAFDLADQVIAMAGLLGQHRQQQQSQVARGKDPWPAVATLTAVAALESVMAFAMFAVGVMFTHGGLRLR